jgi:hypothetical protein
MIVVTPSKNAPPLLETGDPPPNPSREGRGVDTLSDWESQPIEGISLPSI